MADKYNLTESDIKVLKIFGETLKSIIRDFNSESKIVQQMESNYAKVSSKLNIFSELLSKAGRAKIEEIKSIEGISKVIEEYRRTLSSNSSQLAKYNEKFIDSDIQGVTLDLEKILNSKQFAEVIKKQLFAGVDATAEYFSGILSKEGLKALNKIVKETKKVSIGDAKDLKEKKKESEETLKVAKQTTEEIKKQVNITNQTSSTPRRRGRPKKNKTEEITTLEDKASRAEVKYPIAPYKVGSIIPTTSNNALIPHPLLYKYPSTALTPTGIVGSANSEFGERIRKWKQRHNNDILRAHYGMSHKWDSAIKLGAASSFAMLPQFSEEEIAKREAKIKSDNTPPVLGSTEPDEDELLRRQRRRENALSRVKSKGAYQVAHTGSPEAIMLGSATQQGEDSFEEQAQREEDSKNRRRFVADLATAIIALQKKNPIVDLLKWAVLIMGKHLPVLSAALITLAPLVGIFKGIKVINAIRTAMAGGKIAKNAPRAARLVQAAKGSNSIKALFGFGPNSWGSQLTKNVGAQFVNGFKNNGGIKGALSWGTKAIGVNMQSLPWVQKTGGLIHNAAQVTGRIFRHPQWMGAIAKGRALQTAGRVALGAGKLALGAGKLAFRGLASPIMMGIDALCGFLATKGGKWWQRLLGMLLKVVTLGFMSDKKVRQIVGMKEQDAVLQQQANNDEERRHQERIGWWDRFWAWLKNILPWAKGDDVTKKGDQTEAPTLGAADTDQALKDSIAKKKEELVSDKYKVGTKAYNKAIDEFKKEYATKETAGYWASKKSHDKAYKEKLNSEEAQKYAVNKLGTEAKALRSDIQRAEAVMNGGVATGGIMASATGGKYGKGTFAGHNVTSGFGKRNTGIAGASTDHKGIDLDYNYENVGAFAAGKVIFAGQQTDKKTGKLTGYGNYVVVQDAGGMKHTYGHLSRIGVQKGQQVALGQSIGISGNTGTSGGAHLHYGVQDKNNNFLNPLAVSSSSAKEYLEALKASDAAAGTSTMTEVATKEKEQASSEIRDGLAKLVGAKNASNKQERARNIILSSVDVTGSLGVWGITQLNNGVMRTGR